MGVVVRAATPARWKDIVALFERPGPRGGTPIPSGCWCQFWHLRGRAYWEDHGERNRARLEQEVRAGPPPGLIAYEEGDSVGWCRIGPRSSFERLQHSRTLLEPADDEVWSIVCFYVHPSAKRRGVASALLAASIPYARAAGATLVEGYAARPDHPNIDSYTGYLPMFLAAGFEEVRSAGRRTIVRLPLTT